MKTYTICGSMRFAEKMQEISYYLETQKGYNILQCVLQRRHHTDRRRTKTAFKSSL